MIKYDTDERHSMTKLNLIVMDNARELGASIDEHLMKKRGAKSSFIVPIEMVRFSNAEGKVVLNGTVRDNDVYIIGDVGNYDQTYITHNRVQYMTPDEHFQDIKRTISAMSGHANRVTLIEPLLYESRQDKRKGKESLDCAIALQELEHLGVRNLITIDAHNPSVCNAVPRMAFSNIYPTSKILESVYKNEGEELANATVIAPDEGAIERAKFYSELLGCDLGFFYKRRDYYNVTNGKNLIKEHAYLGPDVAGKNVIVVDDMIASGGSVLKVIEELKNRGARKVFVCVTFALFTEGIGEFSRCFQGGLLNGVYVTNVSYVPQEIKNQPWFYDVDCSELLADIINRLNRGTTLAGVNESKDEVYQRFVRMRKKK
jgi:ribose-phosphate pyrophosphokinase